MKLKDAEKATRNHPDRAQHAQVLHARLAEMQADFAGHMQTLRNLDALAKLPNPPGDLHEIIARSEAALDQIDAAIGATIAKLRKLDPTFTEENGVARGAPRPAGARRSRSKQNTRPAR